MNEKKQTDSLGLQVGEYSQIVIFRDEKAFLTVLGANPHMEAIFGARDYEKQIFPGLYIAGVLNK